MFPQKVYKAEAWKLESLAEVGKLKSDNKQTKNWSVKIGTCQQKLEKWKTEKRKREIGNLTTETWKLESEKQKCESRNLPAETWKV